jgi:hypothetical protein
VPRARRDDLLKDNFISSQEISFSEMKKYPEDVDNNEGNKKPHRKGNSVRIQKIDKIRNSVNIVNNEERTELLSFNETKFLLNTSKYLNSSVGPGNSFSPATSQIPRKSLRRSINRTPFTGILSPSVLSPNSNNTSINFRATSSGIDGIFS